MVELVASFGSELVAGLLRMVRTKWEETLKKEEEPLTGVPERLAVEELLIGALEQLEQEVGPEQVQAEGPVAV